MTCNTVIYHNLYFICTYLDINTCSYIYIHTPHTHIYPKSDFVVHLQQTAAHVIIQ